MATQSVSDMKQLDEKLKAMDKVFVLFYASWCPYSQRFLPIYSKWAEENPQNYLKMVIDEQDDVTDKYSIDVYPTVLYFEKGEVSKRLDGVSGAGLSGKNLTDFVKICKAP